MKEQQASSSQSAVIQVVVGILRRESAVLLCQRLPNARYPLYWEFPGGKVEEGESLEEALVRELREELAIEARPGQLLRSDRAEYADAGTFEVHYFMIESYDGSLVNRNFNAIRWVEPPEFPAYNILEGNRAICRDLMTSRDL